MRNIFWQSVGRDCCVSVDVTTNKDYAHDCFDGTEKEWEEVLADANLSNPPMFYIVSSGLAGEYMRDTVSVFGRRAYALNAARDEVKRAREESEGDWE